MIEPIRADFSTFARSASLHAELSLIDDIAKHWAAGISLRVTDGAHTRAPLNRAGNDRQGHASITHDAKQSHIEFRVDRDDSGDGDGRQIRHNAELLTETD